ncbi:MAG: NF038129 family PEP-CTERM protein [Luteolibacter sp.]|uniref:NF038129 family PEP-CTERM protein n=1 Tax=Luteolibacter sp. TaxID=1962973 RepID=UPI00326732A4
MKNRTFLKSTLAAACALLAASSARASVTYYVNVNTSALVANISAPFSLDFQLTGSAGNTATVSNFNFGGGSATPGTENTFGGASGSVGSTVVLSDASNFSNEFFQEFTPGSTLSFTINLDSIIGNPTPDAFSFSILDGTLSNITTTGLGDSLLMVNINGTSYGTQTMQTGSGTGAFSGVSLTAVPEPSAALLGVMGCGLAFVRRRRA